MGFADDMAELDGEFEAAKEKPRLGGGAMLRDGRHQVIIREARIEHDSQNDRYSMVWQFTNQEGSVRKFFNLDHEVGREIAAQDTALVGYKGKLSGLQEACEEEFFIGLVCEIGIKTKPGADRDYTNVYVNRCMGKGDLADFEPPTGGSENEPSGAKKSILDDDSDIPF